MWFLKSRSAFCWSDVTSIERCLYLSSSRWLCLDAPIISFAVFLFYSCLSRFLSLSMVHVFLSFLVYFPTFTSFFPPSPWNLIGLSPVLWRLRIRVSTAQTSSTLRNIEKEGNDKKEGAIGDWGWGPPVTRSRSMYYVIWGKVLVNSLPRCEEELSDTITTGRKPRSSYW